MYNHGRREKRGRKVENNKLKNSTLAGDFVFFQPIFLLLKLKSLSILAFDRDDCMLEITYEQFDKDIARLAEEVKKMQINTMICQFAGGKPVSKIYLENMKRSPNSRKIKV